MELILYSLEPNERMAGETSAKTNAHTYTHTHTRPNTSSLCAALLLSCLAHTPRQLMSTEVHSLTPYGQRTGYKSHVGHKSFDPNSGEILSKYIREIMISVNFVQRQVFAADLRLQPKGIRLDVLHAARPTARQHS